MTEKQLIADEPTTTKNSTFGTSTREGFQNVKKAWAGSLIIKIMSGVIFALIVLFFILMLVYVSKNGTCNKDLQSQKSLVTSKDSEIRRYKSENEDLSSKLDSERRKSSQLQGEVTKLQTQIKELNAKIEEKDKEIVSLKADKQKLQEEKEGLEREITKLQDEIKTKDSEISNLHGEVSKRDAEIAKIKKEIITYQWILGGSGVAHVGQIIDEIVTHIGLSTQTQKAESLDSENRDLKGKLQNANSTIELLNKEMERLKQDIEEVNKLRQQCQSELAHERQLYEDCMHEQTKLHQQIAIIPSLALEQAKLQFLMQETNYTITATPIYNGTDLGYDRDSFFSRVGDKKPTVSIYKSNTGYVFGGALNIVWPKTSGFYADAKAFTFSTTNNRICPIRESQKERAININMDKFMEFGDHEFTVEKSAGKHPQGDAEADRTYSCGARDPHSFYADSQYFTISELVVYEVKLQKTA